MMKEKLILWIIRWVWRKHYTLLDAIAGENGRHLHANPKRRKS